PPHVRRPQKVRMTPPLAKLFFYINDTFILRSRKVLKQKDLNSINEPTELHSINYAALRNYKTSSKQRLLAHNFAH
ncbi:MAG: hypothetical protein ACI8ZW_001107, partial [Yoonia sp.]